MSHWPALRQSLVPQLGCTQEFLSHMKEVFRPSSSFLSFSPPFTICNGLRVGENAARNESDAFSMFYLPSPSV